MSTERADNTKDRHVHPLVAAGTTAVALAATLAAALVVPAWLTSSWSGPTLGLAICLVAGTIVAYQVPLRVARHTHVYITSVAFYLLAALVPAPLAAVAAALACFVGEWSVRQRTGTLWNDWLALAGRNMAIVLAASVVAHLSPAGTTHTLLLLAAAFILLVGDFVTLPIILYRLTRRAPLEIMVTTARAAYLLESAQYLVAVLAALAWNHQFWSLVLLAAPTVLVYLAFRANVEAQDARAAAQHAAEALRESEQRYRGLFENASDIVFTVDLSGHFTSVNEVSEQILGYDRDELLGLSLSDIVQPADQPAVADMLLAAGSRTSAVTQEFDVCTRDRRQVTVEVSAQAVYADSHAVGIQGIARDVTERRRAEAERAVRARELATRILEAQEAERKRISRELHDETAQSLSILLTHLDLMEQHVPTGSPQLADALGRAGALAKRVLDEVRTLSHDLRPTILDDVGLCPALEWLAGEYRQTYGGTVHVQADAGSAARLSGEEELALFRITQEALTNSGKHGGATDVSVSLDVSQTLVTLTVEDNGRGFDMRDVKRPSKEGHLGLYGMRERAGLLDGTVRIASTPQEGTRVIAEIPLSQPAESGASETLSEVS